MLKINHFLFLYINLVGSTGCPPITTTTSTSALTEISFSNDFNNLECINESFIKSKGNITEAGKLENGEIPKAGCSTDVEITDAMCSTDRETDVQTSKQQTVNGVESENSLTPAFGYVREWPNTFPIPVSNFSSVLIIALKKGTLNGSQERILLRHLYDAITFFNL